jgi:UrcA family protein
MHKSLIVAASLMATATLFVVTPGVAMAQAVESSVAVRYSDLDLATPQGQRALERRIARAARSICGVDAETTGTRIASPEANDCYRQALRNVRERVASAIANGKRGA